MDQAEKEALVKQVEELKAKIANLEAELEKAKQESAESESKLAEHAKAENARAAAEREKFLDQHAKKFAPKDRAMFAAMLERADAEKLSYSMEDGGEKKTVSVSEQVRAFIAAMPELPEFKEYGRRSDGTDGAGQDQDEEKRKILAYCKAHNLNPDDYSDYRRAMIATIEYTTPPPAGMES